MLCWVGPKFRNLNERQVPPWRLFPTVMSTSPANSSDAQSTKKKRACDYCRLKRVICHPQSNGEPCPRCLEKGVEYAPTQTHAKVQADSPIQVHHNYIYD